MNSYFASGNQNKKMRDSQLFNTLRELQNQEWAELDLFVRSPFFNKEALRPDSALMSLFQYIFAHRESLDWAGFEKEKVYATLFVSSSYKKNKLDKLMSSLLEIVRKYLCNVSLEADSSFNKLLGLSKFYRKTNQPEKFKNEIDKLRKELEIEKIKDIDHVHKRWILEYEAFLFESQLNKRKGDLNINNSINALDTFYFMTKLKLETDLAQQEKFVTLLPTTQLIPTDLIYQLGAHQSWTEFPLISIYLNIFSLFKNNENFDKEFDLYRALLKNSSSQISRTELKSLYTYLRNFCTAQYNAGKSEYLSILFEIYSELLENGLIYESNKLPNTAFTNITIVGLKLRNFTWTDSFQKSHQQKISGTDHPEEVYNLNRANYFFHIKNYEGAWDLLTGKYEDPSYNRSARRMEIKILYEKNDFDLLDYKINAFKAF
ncbi:MAG: hypothetical protein MUF43_13905, partial [Flavobacterium sp.]|nr:hypothetical protein [Flavobacterium sp.]